MVLTTADVATSFREAMKRCGIASLHSYIANTHVMAFALVSLARRLETGGPLWLSANDQLAAERFGETFGLCAVASYESLLDFALYEGAADPYRMLITAQLATTPDDYVGPDSTTEDNDYILALFELLQVWSPNRLLVARASDALLPALQKRIEEIVQGYHPQIAPGHRVFSLFLPSSWSDAQFGSCRGWESHPDGMHPLPPSALPP